MKVYIIEDDISTVINYEVILKECGVHDFSVINSVRSAQEKIETYPPDLVILDLYLNDELSINLIPSLNAVGSDIIIVTGYPQNGFVNKVLGFDVVSFLPKPVNKYSLKFQIQSIIKKRETIKEESFCYVKSKNNIVRIPYSKIQMLETEGNYTSIFTNSEKFVLKRSLKNVSSSLPSEMFTRVHRNFVVNNNNIKQLDMKNNQLEMLNKTVVQIGGKYRNEIKNAIGAKFNVI